MVIARATDGDIGVLPGHAPLVAGLDIWPLRVLSDEGERQISGVQRFSRGEAGEGHCPRRLRRIAGRDRREPGRGRQGEGRRPPQGGRTGDRHRPRRGGTQTGARTPAGVRPYQTKRIVPGRQSQNTPSCVGPRGGCLRTSEYAALPAPPVRLAMRALEQPPAIQSHDRDRLQSVNALQTVSLFLHNSPPKWQE